DDRNLRWRHLFQASADDEEAADPLAQALECTVRPRGKHYSANLPEEAQIYGFPSTVIIRFAARPRHDTLIATINRDIDGSPYRGLLYAEEASSTSLANLDPPELKRLTDWLLDGGERAIGIRAYAKTVSRLGLVR